jgi:uncharacterized protein (TIGR02271 family)
MSFQDEPFERQQAVPVGTLVCDAEGQTSQVTGSDDANGVRYLLLQDLEGRQLRVPQHMLAGSQENYRLPFAFSNLDVVGGSKDETHVLPVIQEQLQIAKREVDAGRGVRVHRQTVAHTQVVDEPLRQDVVEVTRVPVDKLVDSSAPPIMRQEGDTLVIPVLEEVLVVERRLRLKEEVRITRQQREVHAPQSVVLKSYEVQVERFDENREASGTPPL